MKSVIRILLLLLVCTQLHAQSTCIRLTKLHGDTTYNNLFINDTSTGFTTGGGSPPPPCSGPLVTFRTLTGGYQFQFKPKPVYAITVTAYGMDDGEDLRVQVNGVPHIITMAEMIAYTNCGSAGNPPITLDAAGVLHAPAGFGEYNGGSFIIQDCNGIDSFEVYGHSVATGISFDICVDTLRPAYCLTANANTPLCAGQPLNLYATGDSSGGATYAWYGPGGFISATKHITIPAVTTANSGKYYVVKTLGTSHDTDTIMVVVKPTPALTVGSNSPICYHAGNVITLTATPYAPPETFSWTGPNSFTSALQNPFITPVTDADTGTYTVVADLNGCTATGSVHVVYISVPAAPVITGITSYCAGQTFVPFTITGAAGSSLLWYTAATGGTGSSTALTVNTSVAGVTTDYVSQSISGCESPRASITVTVNPTPAKPTITGTASYCQYDIYVPPVATGTGTTLWYTTATGGTGSATAPVISTATPGTYAVYATQTTGTCESPRTLFTIKVNVRPSNPVILADPSTYCLGQAFVPFTVASGIGIIWYTTPTGGGGTSTPPSLSTATAGIQTVYASQTVLGCESGRTAVSITVIPTVTASFDYKVKYGCTADTVVFTNRSLLTTTYTWHFGDRFSSSEENPSHVYLVQAIDTVTLTASVGSCSADTVKYLDLRHPLHAHFDIDTDLVCAGGTVVFTDTSSVPLNGISRLWSYGDYSVHPPVTTQSTSHQYPVSGTFTAYLVIRDTIPCTDTFFRTIQVDSISTNTVSLTDTVICRGTYITLRGDFTPVGLDHYTWNLGNNDSVSGENPLVYAYDQAGVFNVTERAYYRICPNTTSTMRQVTVLPQPAISIGSDATICKGSESLTLADNINAANPLATWQWNTGETSSSINVVAPGIYTAMVKIQGCYASASVTVSNDCYMNIPNAFTPNDDGSNDYFYPHQYLSNGLSSFKMSIYNRWGVKVFESTSLDGRGWDGKLNDVPQPEGVYIYTVEAEFKDGQHERHQGNVTLLR